jgi:acyl-CoA reductase-like NAD-dependent aldehyde dehydrogenase
MKVYEYLAEGLVRCADAGIPTESIAIYPGAGAEIGGAILASCRRSMIFGGTATVERYKGNPRVQAHGPGFSKILIGDDQVDQWEKYLDLMVESVYINSGRGCINCSGLWASRHTKEIAQAIAERLGPIEAKPPEDPQAGTRGTYRIRSGATRRRGASNYLRGDMYY